MSQIAQEYINDVQRNKTTYDCVYDLEKVTKDGEFIVPNVDMRGVEYGSRELPKQESVQITIKPILSFRHARKASPELVDNDLRTRVIRAIQSKLDEKGLSHYVARPGGKSSIDVTHEKVDKAYALEFLINHLNLRGNTRLGQKLGSNAIYFGDEVIARILRLGRG